MEYQRIVIINLRHKRRSLGYKARWLLIASRLRTYAVTRSRVEKGKREKRRKNIFTHYNVSTNIVEIVNG